MLFSTFATGADDKGAAPKPGFILGVDANYSLDMESKGARWKWNAEETELFSGMRKHGVEWLRVRLWTSEQGVNGRDYATSVVKRATAAGLMPYLVIFLSSDWADMVKQPAPDMWKDLPLDERAKAIQAYAKDTTVHFRANGLTAHLYEVGNEIDYGICGVYPGKSAKKNPESLGKRCWPDAAKLILACEAGVKEVDPEAKFLLHIAHWWDADFCVAFFQAMLGHGVQVDYAGLSYFPSSKIGDSLTFEQFKAVVDRLSIAIDRPIIIPETAYPSTADFQGQFARWRNEAPGYSLTPEGQQKWLADFIRFCRAEPYIAGMFYWSPEWYGDGMWKAFALFDTAGEAKPAWASFAARDAK